MEHYHPKMYSVRKAKEKEERIKVKLRKEKLTKLKNIMKIFTLFFIAAFCLYYIFCIMGGLPFLLLLKVVGFSLMLSFLICFPGILLLFDL